MKTNSKRFGELCRNLFISGNIVKLSWDEFCEF